jgi:hypothetical protein
LYIRGLTCGRPNRRRFPHLRSTRATDAIGDQFERDDVADGQCRECAIRVTPMKERAPAVVGANDALPRTLQQAPHSSCHGLASDTWLRCVVLALVHGALLERLA